MAATDAKREQQIKQAEELFFSGPQRLGFAKALFFGQFNSSWIMPYPRLSPEELPRLTEALAEVRCFVESELDPVQIDFLPVEERYADVMHDFDVFVFGGL